jgi:hypothetical protein
VLSGLLAQSSLIGMNGNAHVCWRDVVCCIVIVNTCVVAAAAANILRSRTSCVCVCALTGAFSPSPPCQARELVASKALLPVDPVTVPLGKRESNAGAVDAIVLMRLS